MRGGIERGGLRSPWCAVRHGGGGVVVRSMGHESGATGSMARPRLGGGARARCAGIELGGYDMLEGTVGMLLDMGWAPDGLESGDEE